jgi:hypothetical protein
MRPWVALWPLTGSFGYRDLPLDEWVYNVLNPYNLTTEAIGLVALSVVILRYRLHERRRLGLLLRTGRLPRSILFDRSAPNVSAERSTAG